MGEKERKKFNRLCLYVLVAESDHSRSLSPSLLPESVLSLSLSLFRSACCLTGSRCKKEEQGRHGDNSFLLVRRRKKAETKENASGLCDSRENGRHERSRAAAETQARKEDSGYSDGGSRKERFGAEMSRKRTSGKRTRLTDCCFSLYRCASLQ